MTWEGMFARSALAAFGAAAIASPAATALAQAPAEDTVLYTPAPPPGTVNVPPAESYSPPTAGVATAPDTDAEPAQDAAAAHAQADGIAGYFPGEGFALKSTDGNYKLGIGLQAGYRFQPYWIDGDPQDRNAFFVLRPNISGYIFREWIRFSTTFEFVGNPPYLLDSFVEVKPWDEFGIRAGQQWTPFSRHEYAGPAQLLFPDWSAVANYFWTGRDKGATLFGSLLDGRIDYYAGAYSGSPLRQFTTLAGTWVSMGRVTLNPMGPVASDEAPYITSETRLPRRVSFTLQGAGADYELAQENFNPGTFSFVVEGTNERRKMQMGSADFWLQGPRYVLFVEGYLRRTDFGPSEDYGDFPAYLSAGVWGQAGLMLIDRLLDVGARFNWLNPSNDLANDRAYALEGQVGYYPLQSTQLVLRLRYGYGHQEQPREDAQGPVALLLPPGDNHLLTFQLMLAI